MSRKSSTHLVITNMDVVGVHVSMVGPSISYDAAFAVPWAKS